MDFLKGLPTVLRKPKQLEANKSMPSNRTLTLPLHSTAWAALPCGAPTKKTPPHSGAPKGQRDARPGQGPPERSAGGPPPWVPPPNFNSPAQSAALICPGGAVESSTPLLFAAPALH
jgi:hypothetical protein